LVLWSRLGDYDPRWLEELLAEGKIFEYWSHVACFLPIEDYPLYRHRMLNADSMGWQYSDAWMKAHSEQVNNILRLIRERGPVRSSDFTRTDGKPGGWWEWKPEKRTLEMLFTAGELMIARRHNFQRIYDLRERVLPSWSDEQLLAPEEAERQLALKAVRALGVTNASWVSDYFRTPKQRTRKLTEQLAQEGALLSIHVEGWEETAYAHPSHRKLIMEAAAGRLRPELTTLLSPFDPLVWDRTRALALFGFDYRLECYTPAPKRHYGYFTLPILHRGQLIGRLDPKAHRREGIFEIKSLYLEESVNATDEMINDVAVALRECAAWHRTPEVVVHQSVPKTFAARLQRALRRA
ncbi:MAG: YcaQ family DNA glycosylase, partial [Pyrinomonadaceae bacterium]|nr:YcaQ family DNA glycosylase [Pyrinomonadaceae bacterium]